MRALLVLVMTLILAGPVRAVSPYDLFFRAEADAMRMGGGDVPGDVIGRPELRRPTSLLASDAPLVRLDLCSQTPVQLTEDGTVLGRWRSDAAQLTLVQPLDERWTMGATIETIDDSIWYDEFDSYRIDMREDSYTFAAACRLSDRWSAGATYRWGGLSGAGKGSAIAEWLDLPADNRKWPTLDIDENSVTVAAGYNTDEWAFGALRGWSEPSATLEVTRDVYDYTAPMDRGADWYELWGVRHCGADDWWASLRKLQSDGSGTIFLGAGGRGDTSLELRDRALSFGWRRESADTMTQAQIDIRKGEYSTYEQGYAGLLPGISADVFTLRSRGYARVRSLRLGHQRRLTGNLFWSAAAGAHVADVEQDSVLKRVSGLGSSPRVESESHLEGGQLRLWALTLGIEHRTQDLRILVTGTAGYVQLNDAFDDVVRQGPDDGVRRRLEVQPLVTAAAEWRL